MPKTKKTTITTEIDPPENGFVVEDEQEPVSYQQDALDWIATAGYDDEDRECILYRLEGKRKVFCWKWHYDIPDMHEIGIKFGSGAYKLYILFPNRPKGKNLRTYRLHIDAEYDKAKEAAEQKSLLPMQGDGGNGGMGTLNMTLAVMKELMKMFQPLISNNGNSGNVGPVVPDISSMMLKQYETFGEVMNQQLMKNYKFSTEMMDNMAKNNGYEDDGGNEVDNTVLDLVEKFLPTLKEFLPILLGRGKASQLAVSAVKKNKDFKKIVSDRQKLALVVDALEKDKDVGPDKIANLFKKFGINRA